jgi:hypothetical protein
MGKMGRVNCGGEVGSLPAVGRAKGSLERGGGDLTPPPDGGSPLLKERGKRWVVVRG